MNKSNISRRDFMNGFALSLAAGSAMASIELLARAGAGTYAYPPGLAGLRGSHACFYSDATVLTAQASSCTPYQYTVTQIPYAIIATLISVVGYLLLVYF